MLAENRKKADEIRGEREQTTNRQQEGPLSMSHGQREGERGEETYI